MPAGLAEKIRKHPLAAFFIIAYLGSWVLMIPCILIEWGIIEGDFSVYFTLKAFAGPFLAAFLVTRIISGKEGVRELRSRIRRVRVGYGYYLFAVVLIPLLIVVSMLLQPGAAGSAESISAGIIIRYFVYFIVVFFGGGPLAEEPGWRGFALPRLQARFGAFKGTMVLGLFWVFWHAPDFLTSAQGGGPGGSIRTVLINFALFFVLVMALSVIMTWLYNKSGASLFIVLLAHAGVNTPQVVIAPLLPAVDTFRLNLGAMLVFLLLAIVVTAASRGRLGYSKNML